MTKIIQIVTQLEPGGAQRVALDLSDYFYEEKKEILTVFLYRKRQAFENHRNLIVLFPNNPHGLGYIVILIRLFNLIRKEAPDVVISHTHYANIVAQIISWMRGIKKRIAVHHNSPKTFPRIARLADRFLGNSGIYTNIVAVADHVKADFSKYDSRYYNKIIVILNGTSFGDSTSQNITNRVAQVKLIVVGRLADQKNHMFLLDIIRHLPALSLYIIGEGELREVLESRIKELELESRVFLVGEIERNSISEYMQDSIFLFPSKFEAMPLAVLEAMKAGLYIIASDIPASRELLADTGILLPLDEIRWVKAIEFALKSPIEQERLGKNAMDRASLFTLGRMGEEYAKII